MSVSDVFVSFFYEDHCAGFKLDKKSDAWKEDMDAPERKQFKHLFAKIKRAVRVALMHADEFPLIPDDSSKCKEVLRRTATAAEERIRSSLGFEDEKISICTLVNLPKIKDVEKTLKLPSNTPDDCAKFSKSN